MNKNEVVEIHNIDEENLEMRTTQAAIEINIREVICGRKLQWTNTLHPAHKYDRQAFRNGQEAEKSGILTCRWKMVSTYKKRKLQQRTLVKLRAHEVLDSTLRIHDDHLLSTWRGGKVRGGSHRPNNLGGLLEDMSCNHIPLHRAPNQEYTHADFFCGAGGVSCGVRSAGQRTIVACDMDHNACSSYEMNFPETDIYEMSIYDLVTTAPDFTVDILHLSPPC